MYQLGNTDCINSIQKIINIQLKLMTYNEINSFRLKTLVIFRTDDFTSFANIFLSTGGGTLTHQPHSAFWVDFES